MNFLPFFIAKRLCIQNSNNRMTLLISFLSKAGISISIFALIISFSALNGFQKLINKNVLSSIPHGIIVSANNLPLNWKYIEKKLNTLPDIIYSEPYLLMNGILLKNNQIKLIHIKSFKNSKYLKKYFYFTKKLYDFNFYNKNEIIISSEISNNLSIHEGDLVDLIILEKISDIQKYSVQKFSFKIKAIFQSNGISNSDMILIPWIFFQKTFHFSNEVKAIEIYMSDPLKAEKIIFNAAKKVKVPLFLYTWIGSYKNIYHNIKKIKSIIYITLILLIIISCFSIISISLISIAKKTKEIAILRSIGADKFLIQRIFLFYGIRSIIIGNIIGLSAGIILIMNFNKVVSFLEKHFKNNLLLNNIYFKNFLLLEINILDIIIIFISTLIIGIVMNYYPAYYASRIEPSKILKQY